MIHKGTELKNEVREKMRGGEGAVTVRHYFVKGEFKSSVRLCARLILPPGAGIGPHRHDEEDEVYIVASGSGVLDDGITQTPVNAGDAVLTGRGESHSIRNDGKDDLEVIAMIMCY